MISVLEIVSGQYDSRAAFANNNSAERNSPTDGLELLTSRIHAMPKPSLAFVIPKELRGERLDRVLEKLVSDHTRAQLQKLVRRGGIRLNGNPVRRSNIRVQGGERLTIIGVQVAAPPGESRARNAAELRTLYEDEFIVVVDKPPGMLTHDAPGVLEDSLSALLVERLGPLPTHRGEDRPGIVHRLDRETSGVIVAARDASTMDALAFQFRERTVGKRYLALVHGTPVEREFEIDLPLEPQRGRGDREQVAQHGSGKTAQTAFVVEEAFGATCLLACHPRTGRRHQIRVHSAAAGHPVLFDKLYRRPDRAPLPDGAPLLRRHALHASDLEFEHPKTGERLSFRAPLPADFDALLSWLRSQNS